MTDNSKLLYNYLKTNHGLHFTAVDIAEDLKLKTSSINLLFNVFVKKGWGKRTVGVVQLPNGKKTELKFLTLTDAGLAINPDDE